MTESKRTIYDELKAEGHRNENEKRSTSVDSKVEAHQVMVEEPNYSLQVSPNFRARVEYIDHTVTE